MYLTMPQPEEEILPGTSVSVAVDMVAAGITSIDGYNIPMTALQAGNQDGEFFVWKLNGDAVTKVEVTIDQVNGEGANCVIRCCSRRCISEFQLTQTARR